jgi:hypothetical protein
MTSLIDGSVIVNDKPIPVIPGSVTRKKGRGETKVTTQSLGNGNVETVASTDLETAKSYFKFAVKPTDVSARDVDTWKLNTGANTIRFVIGGVYENYKRMSVINDPEYPDSNDAVIEVEMEGDPLPK